MSGRLASIAMTVPADRVRPARSRKRRRTRAESALSSAPEAGASLSAPDLAIAEALRAWRQDEAKKRAIAPFMILHDRTLREIASSRPRSRGELHAVPGIGPAKLDAYGEAILLVVASVAADV
jgi:ATP-dependent DNA helicase RecQ